MFLFGFSSSLRLVGVRLGFGCAARLIQLPGKGMFVLGIFFSEFGVGFPRLANRNKQKITSRTWFAAGLAFWTCNCHARAVWSLEGDITGLSRMREEGAGPCKTGSCKVSSAVV